MGELAQKMRAIGVRPAIWIRPLMGEKGVLDPTRALDTVARDIRRLREWGYELIKHDFTAYDMFGRWGFEMGSEVTRDGWSFADRSRTDAEITLALYRTIREAAGDAVLIGCNTAGHLGAGFFELQRIGDDNSGQEWERTRKMGINTLAFRLPQHGAFFAADADCVGNTDQVPWEMNRQWMELLARSGTPLFVSSASGHEDEVQKAFDIALQPHSAEPLDWMETTCPSRWNLDGEVRSFDWFGTEGVP
jgi:alpha-galactosidase